MNFTFFLCLLEKNKCTYVVHIIFLLDSTVLESLPCSQGTKLHIGNMKQIQKVPEHLPTYEIKMPQGPADPGCNAFLSHCWFSWPVLRSQG